jgi:hypothetical protein
LQQEMANYEAWRYVNKTAYLKLYVLDCVLGKG